LNRGTRPTNQRAGESYAGQWEFIRAFPGEESSEAAPEVMTWKPVRSADGRAQDTLFREALGIGGWGVGSASVAVSGEYWTARGDLAGRTRTHRTLSAAAPQAEACWMLFERPEGYEAEF
jgi:hypothetical protein